jgi:hypothetical protein
MASLRVVQVQRPSGTGPWVNVSLSNVKAGEKCRINEEGTITIGFAAEDGFMFSPGVGGIRLITDLITEATSSSRGKLTQ